MVTERKVYKVRIILVVMVFYNSMAWTGIPRRPSNFVSGLAKMGIKDKDLEKLEICLNIGRLPRFVLDAVIENEGRIDKIHPDDYPWDEFHSDSVFYGLLDQGVNCEAVWSDASNYR